MSYSSLTALVRWSVPTGVHSDEPRGRFSATSIGSAEPEMNSG